MDMTAVFLEEANEHLINLEEALLELETDPDNNDHINTAFRAIHTIKGSAGMVGFGHISYFTHDIETLLDKIRNGELALTDDLTSLFLDSKDHLETLVNSTITPELELVSETLLKRIRAANDSDTAALKANTALKAAPEVDESDSDGQNDPFYWHIDVTPNEETFQDGFDVLPVIRELSELGNAVISTHLKNDWTIESPALTCALSFTVLLDENASREGIDEAFMFVEDDWNIDIRQVYLRDVEDDRLGDILVKNNVISRQGLDDSTAPAPKLGERLVEQGLVEPEQIESALKEQNFVRNKKSQEKERSKQSSIKVPADKLDALMNLVGELVIMQSSVAQYATATHDEELQSISEEMGRLTTELRDNTFNIRMLPIGSTFGRFRRLIRDLSQGLNKKVALETLGAETEMDKMVLEKLGDPLVHLLRNSLDHGIEMPDVRAAAGKPEEGTIVLQAGYEQGLIKVEISDDGAGLNTERIKTKAMENGLINDSSSLSDEQIHQLIFEPGFSTAAAVTDISGRGVGMDVVKTSIEDLGGTVKIASQSGGGTKVTVLLPMTLAIIEGLMVKVSDDYYIIPLSMVMECIEVSKHDLSQDKELTLVHSRGELTPTIRLRDTFDIAGESPDIEQVIILQTNSGQFGLKVDEVVGQHQTVIKKLGRLYDKTPSILGATILGNGNVALILDINQLVSEYQHSQTQRPLMELAQC